MSNQLVHGFEGKAAKRDASRPNRVVHIPGYALMAWGAGVLLALSVGLLAGLFSGSAVARKLATALLLGDLFWWEIAGAGAFFVGLLMVRWTQPPVVRGE